ncbi:response regulator transcription factor [Streptomyces sp. ISL-98]|uniref:hypothetical protein n=1 Tax=Streptomyces sp. ISL-98 TaxID=2819192 RepID=UPI001BE5BEDA|nr:hypothetical protein [Streptomyces sp. ISL-98]MBT2509216.1 response regulator transcription factor [Streptomyces sp. ISL-98]
MTRVLIVDDHRTTLARGLAAVLELPCDIYTCKHEVEAGINSDWTAAFVDFDLNSPTETGLSIMEFLFDRCPEVRRIVHTSLSENGRTLFALAACAWFDAEVILDKECSETQICQAVNLLENPTPRRWLERRRRAADIIDDLLQPGWLPLWQIWPEVNGSVKAAKARLGKHQPDPRTFAKEALAILEKHRDMFGLASLNPVAGRAYSSYAVPLTVFAEANSKFFGAPDLAAVLASQSMRY